MRNKIGRNNPCYCGSGLKYKKYCLKCKQMQDDGYLQKLQIGLQQQMGDGARDMVFLEPNSPEIRMSEIILEFAGDMLKHAYTNSEKKNAIDLACLAWNLALFKEIGEGEYEKQFNFFLKKIGIKKQADKDDIRPLIEALIGKKFDEYPDIDRLIISHEINFLRDELRLNVASVIKPEEIGKSLVEMQ